MPRKKMLNWLIVIYRLLSQCRHTLLIETPRCSLSQSPSNHLAGLTQMVAPRI